MNSSFQANINGTAVEPQALARLAHLRYVSDAEPGFSRKLNGKGFVYLGVRGARLSNPRDVKRIESLAIPPAWTDVWICRFAKGHLQATGHDDRKRKQYLYHERWRDAANLAKFIHIEQFGRILPKLRRAIARDLGGNQLSRTRVLAGMVAVLDATSIRVGNEEYAHENGSYGLTTLRTRHVTEKNHHIELRFKAKGGFHREVDIEEQRLVRLMKQLKRLRGAHVFQYLDADKHIRQATSTDVNDYLREVTGQPFTAKDFRTWKASALAARLLFEQPLVDTLKDRKRIIKNTLADAAAALGNTPTVCRKYYVHPGLLESFERGTFRKFVSGFKPRRNRSLSREEQILANFLLHWKPARQKKAAK